MSDVDAQIDAAAVEMKRRATEFDGRVRPMSEWVAQVGEDVAISDLFQRARRNLHRVTIPLRQDVLDAMNLCALALSLLPRWEDTVAGKREDESRETEQADGVMKFRKRPVVIEACRIHSHLDLEPAAKWVRSEGGQAMADQGDPGPAHLLIATLEGTMRADIGDYIIRGVAGEIYPCKPDVFAATYERVTEGGEDERRETERRKG